MDNFSTHIGFSKVLMDLTNSDGNIGEDIKLMAVSYLLNVVRNKYKKSAELGMHPDDR